LAHAALGIMVFGAYDSYPFRIRPQRFDCLSPTAIFCGKKGKNEILKIIIWCETLNPA